MSASCTHGCALRVVETAVVVVELWLRRVRFLGGLTWVDRCICTVLAWCIQPSGWQFDHRPVNSSRAPTLCSHPPRCAAAGI